VYVTAQSKRYPQQESGYVFDHCRVTAAEGVSELFLGRPWRRYSTVVFLNTEMPALLDPGGWREWYPGETNALSTAFYGEYGSRGPGANPNKREPYSHQLDEEHLRLYSPDLFLRGTDAWQPAEPR
jgi:pectin methylesterase-like acyl-CoA thioesterase